MTAKELVKFYGLEQYQIIKEVNGGFKALFSFNHKIDAMQYINNLEEGDYFIFTMIVKEIDEL